MLRWHNRWMIDGPLVHSTISSVFSQYFKRWSKHWLEDFEILPPKYSHPIFTNPPTQQLLFYAFLVTKAQSQVPNVDSSLLFIARHLKMIHPKVIMRWNAVNYGIARWRCHIWLLFSRATQTFRLTVFWLEPSQVALIAKQRVSGFNPAVYRQAFWSKRP